MSNRTKTKAGTRYLPIPPSLYPYIVEQMQVADNRENNPEKLLFKTTNMPYADKEIVNTSLSRILKHLGIEHMSSHSLRHTYATRSIEAGVTPVVLQKLIRHTYATRSIEAGVTPVVLQKLMGHTDVSITLNTYTSVFDKYKETELEKYYMEQNLLNSNTKLLSNNSNFIDTNSYENKKNNSKTLPPER